MLILFMLSALLIGCSAKDEVKPSADSLLAKDAFAKIDVIRDAYQRKDKGLLQDNADPGVAESLIQNLAFDKAELSFNPTIYKITDEFIVVTLTWQGNWQDAKNVRLENRGVTNFVLQKDALKLIKISGDNPFLMPVSANIR